MGCAWVDRRSVDGMHNGIRPFSGWFCWGLHSLLFSFYFSMAAAEAHAEEVPPRLAGNNVVWMVPL